MKTYKVLYWWHKSVRKQEYVDAINLTVALSSFIAKYGEQEIISIVECE